MRFNRNHYFVLGTILLFLGLQFRLVESFTLTPEATKFVAKKLEKKQQVIRNSAVNLLNTAAPQAVIKKQVRPPRWIGLSLLSVGAVLVLYSIVLKKPES